MSTKAVFRGLDAAARFLRKEWSPLENSDEAFLLRCVDREKRRRVVATLSKERAGKVWKLAAYSCVLFFYGFCASHLDYVFFTILIISLMEWIDFENLDGRIKLIKLMDRISSSTADQKTAA